MKHLTMLLCLLLFVFTNCKKEKLPKPTQQGKNTFGCKIDGKLFVPKDIITVPVSPGLSTFYDETSRELNLYIVEPPDNNLNRLQRSVFIKVYRLTMGVNRLDEANYSYLVIREAYQSDKYYGTNGITGGTLSVSNLDTVRNIISGTFSFLAAPKQANSQNVNVTEGRFDISYK